MSIDLNKVETIQFGTDVNPEVLRGLFKEIDGAINSVSEQQASDVTLTGTKTFTAPVLMQSALNYYISTSGITQDILKISPAVPISSYVVGSRYVTSVTQLPANQSVMSFQINGLPPKPIIRSKGAPLLSNDLTLGQVLEVIYDGSEFVTYQTTNVVEAVSRDLPRPIWVNQSTITLTLPRTVAKYNRVSRLITMPLNGTSYNYSALNTGIGGIDPSSLNSGVHTIGNTYHLYFAQPRTGSLTGLLSHTTSGLVETTIGGVIYDLLQIAFSYIAFSNRAIPAVAVIPKFFVEQMDSRVGMVMYTESFLIASPAYEFPTFVHRVTHVPYTSFSLALKVPQGATSVVLYASNEGGYSNCPIRTPYGQEFGMVVTDGGGKLTTRLPITDTLTLESKYHNGSGSSNLMDYSVASYTVELPYA
jgi:hypothetical protein